MESMWRERRKEKEKGSQKNDALDCGRVGQEF